MKDEEIDENDFGERMSKAESDAGTKKQRRTGVCQSSRVVGKGKKMKDTEDCEEISGQYSETLLDNIQPKTGRFILRGSEKQ